MSEPMKQGFGAGPTRRSVLGGVFGGLLAGGLLVGCSDDEPSKTASGSPSETTPTTPSGPKLSWGPTQAQLDRATALVGEFSDEKLAGQVLVLTFAGTSVEAAASAVTAVHAGGVIVMGDNVVDAEQVRRLNKAVHSAVSADDREFPAVVAVDQEGGLVSRMGDSIPRTPTFMSAGAAIKGNPGDGPKVVSDSAKATGEMLRSLNFTWVYAPDADVTAGPQDPTIGSRSAGSDPTLVSQAVTAAIGGYHEAGIIDSVKHYPGHGSVTTDSHEGLPVQTASLDTLRERDLPPFTAAVKAGVPVIMMSHLAVEAFEPGVPCTLSKAAYESLRKETGFEGVICTDAMNMGAITNQYGAGPAAAKAVIAGADVVLMPADAPAAAKAILAALADGSLPKQRLQEAAARVVALQLMQAEAAVPPERPAKALIAASQALSAAAITAVGPVPEAPVITDSLTVSGGNEADRTAFAAAAKSAGISVGSGPSVYLATGTKPGNADVVVALDTPYVLSKCQASKGKYALYGRTEPAFAALLAVLTGKAKAPGQLPVTLA